MNIRLEDEPRVGTPICRSLMWSYAVLTVKKTEAKDHIRKTKIWKIKLLKLIYHKAVPTADLFQIFYFASAKLRHKKISNTIELAY